MNKKVASARTILIGAMVFSLFGATLVGNALAQGTPLPGSAIPQFVDPLPDLFTINTPPDSDGTQRITLESTEFKAPVMPTGFVPANGEPYAGTYVWGYLQPGQTLPTSYIGPLILAKRGTPTEVTWVNKLGDTATSKLQAWTESTDQTLHWADPFAEGCMGKIAAGQAPSGACAENYAGPIPDVTHLHGAEVPAEIDGGPDAWYTSDGNYHGAAYYAGPGGGGNTAVDRYPNGQEAALLWFHPHPLGVTRLNVYAGLAGAYLLTDPDNDPKGLPPLVPLVIQDRMFDTNGQLYFPNLGINPEHPFWVPEFVGDTIVVNGKVWPYKDVNAQRYSFFILNGSNARTYELFLVDPVTNRPGPPMWVIATDGGYLDAPVKLDPALGQKLLVMPGERYEVIIDFADTTNNPNPSGTYLLRNIARTPYPKGENPNGATLGQILQFRVQPRAAGAVVDASFNPASGGALRGGTGQGSAMVRLAAPTTGTLGSGVTVQKTRQLTLNEVIGAGGPLEILVNNTKWNGMRFDSEVQEKVQIPGYAADGFGNYVSERPMEGETEVWEIVNLTADAHPIHLHLVQFQLLNRQNYNVNRYTKAYEAAFPGGVFIPAYGPPKAYDFYADPPRSIYGGNPDITPYLQGPVRPPLPQEAGWKDTVVMYPGQVTRIVVRWAPTTLAANTPPASASFAFDPGGSDYVWHCHILDHEDNEMMRPTRVTPHTVSRTYRKGKEF